MSEAGLYKNKDYYCSKFKLDAYFLIFKNVSTKVVKIKNNNV